MYYGIILGDYEIWTDMNWEYDMEFSVEILYHTTSVYKINRI